MDYKDKYIKYKTKYLELKNKNNMIGGTPEIIIHISGASWSGKTTLGNKLKTKFGNKIVVKDIDDLRVEFIKEYYEDKEWDIIDKDAYQIFIDNYIDKINKPCNQVIWINNIPKIERAINVNITGKVFLMGYKLQKKSLPLYREGFL